MIRSTATLTALLLAGVVVWIVPGPPGQPGPPPAVAFWDWTGRGSLDDSERTALREMGCDALYAWVGTLTSTSGAPAWTDRGSVPILPTDIALHLVARVGPDLGGATKDPETVAATLIAALQRRAIGHRVVGAQIDCDVPTSRLARYAALLRAIRVRLPTGWSLSATMLLDWADDPGLAAVAEAVDELVPQFYGLVAPAPAGPLIGGGDLPAVIDRLEALRIAYRIGLPTYEQAALFAGDGRLLQAVVPVALPSAVAAGCRIARVMEADEDGALFHATRPTLVGRLRLEPGQRLRIARPTVAGLAQRMNELRHLDAPHCRGVCFFRLPAQDGPTRTLSLAQISAARSGTPTAVRLSAQVRRTNAGWRITVSNTGDGEFFAPEAPARLAIRAPGTRVTVEAASDGLAALSARDGVPCSPLRADGIVADLSLVAAGEARSVDLCCQPSLSAPPTGTLTWRGGSIEVEHVLDDLGADADTPAAAPAGDAGAAVRSVVR